LPEQHNKSLLWGLNSSDGFFSWNEALALLTDAINIAANLREVVAPALLLIDFMRKQCSNYGYEQIFDRSCVSLAIQSGCVKLIQQLLVKRRYRGCQIGNLLRNPEWRDGGGRHAALSHA
jgi:hypothetical protein